MEKDYYDDPLFLGLFGFLGTPIFAAGLLMGTIDGVAIFMFVLCALAIVRFFIVLKENKVKRRILDEIDDMIGRIDEDE